MPSVSLPSAATLAAVNPAMVPGMAIVLGIDKFMSECRALTNICGNGVATIVVGNPLIADVTLQNGGIVVNYCMDALCQSCVRSSTPKMKCGKFGTVYSSYECVGGVL